MPKHRKSYKQIIETVQGTGGGGGGGEKAGEAGKGWSW